MKTHDLIYFDGALQIHLSINPIANICYIYVNDIYNDSLVMRYFNNVAQALDWIESL